MLFCNRSCNAQSHFYITPSWMQILMSVLYQVAVLLTLPATIPLVALFAHAIEVSLENTELCAVSLGCIHTVCSVKGY